MKAFVQTLLVILFIPLFLIGLMSVTVKYQLLSPMFWQETFDTHNVYMSLSIALKDLVEEKTINEGGSRGDVKILTNLITSENLKDFIDINLENILNYVNGKSDKIIVYLPIAKIPYGLLPKNLGIKEKMPLNDALKKLNIVGFHENQIKQIPLIGRSMTYILIIDLALLFIIIIFLYQPGIALILSGVITLMLVFLGNSIKFSNQLVLAFVPYILQNILNLWMWIGIVVTILGLALLFVKKHD